LRLKRLVHAYLPGIAVPLDLFHGPLQTIRPSSSAEDVLSVSSWRTAGPGHYTPVVIGNHGQSYYTGQGWKKISALTLTTNPVTWSTGVDSGESYPEQHLGAAFPQPGHIDIQENVGFFSCGVNLRLGHVVAQSRQPLRIAIGSLSHVDCGKVTARIEPRRGILRVPRFPDVSLFALCEGDWLEYHDLDYALFFGNLRENVAVRCASWMRLPGSSQQDRERIMRSPWGSRNGMPAHVTPIYARVIYRRACRARGVGELWRCTGENVKTHFSYGHRSVLQALQLTGLIRRWSHIKWFFLCQMTLAVI